MKHLTLLKVYKKDDYGVDYNFIFIRFKERSFLQLSIGWFEYGSGPFIQFSSGMGNLLSVLLSIGKFGLTVDLFGHNWYI